MQDIPDKATLLAAVRRFLKADLAGGITDPALRFRVLGGLSVDLQCAVHALTGAALGERERPEAGTPGPWEAALAACAATVLTDPAACADV